jgi:hypothetical protein
MEKTTQLSELHRLVRNMTRKQQQVARLNLDREPHKQRRVAAQRCVRNTFHHGVLKLTYTPIQSYKGMSLL